MLQISYSSPPHRESAVVEIEQVDEESATIDITSELYLGDDGEVMIAVYSRSESHEFVPPRELNLADLLEAVQRGVAHAGWGDRIRPAR